jgi:membrane protein
MMRAAWTLIRESVAGFIDDDLLSRGAAIAYYTVFSIGPVLFIVIGIAGVVFGHEAAQGAIVAQLSGLMGERSAELLQTAIRSADHPGAGKLAAAVGIAGLLFTASGVFGEMRSALNIVWKMPPQRSAIGRVLRGRIASLGLVVALGFLLMVSLAIDAALTVAARYASDLFPAVPILLRLLNFAISLTLTSLLFAAIYKVLPDTPIAWRDVFFGAIVTAVLFTIGKTLIGFYLGSSAVTSSFGAAGALAVMLLWIYYSAQIFLLGAEFVRAYQKLNGRFVSP